MRKIAVIAMFAIVAAMVPMTTASSQPTPGSLDGVGTLMVINSHSTPLDLWIQVEDGGDPEWIEIELQTTDQEEVQVPRGTRNFQLCLAGSTDQTCAGSAPFGTGGSVVVQSNDILNFLISPVFAPSMVYIAENETEETETDHARITLHNGIPATPINLCVGDEHVASTTGAGTSDSSEFNGRDGETRELRIFIGPFTDCTAAPTATTELGFPPGSNTVINITINTNCTSDCGYQIFPGEEPPDSSNNVDKFCAVVLEAANITPWLQELFSEVEVGNEDTYPDPERVEKVLVRIAELLELGNETAPADIRDAWLTATAAFVETGRLAAVDYDIKELTQDQLRELVVRIDTPAEDDHEVADAVALLSAWVPANCFGDAAAALEAEPSFTG